MEDENKRIENKLIGNADAKDWAEEFCRTAASKPGIALDEGTMLGWFANAIMAGFDLEKKKSEKTAHTEKHKKLHQELDELAADFIKDTGKVPSGATIMELMEWSNEQQKG